MKIRRSNFLLSRKKLGEILENFLKTAAPTTRKNGLGSILSSQRSQISTLYINYSDLIP
jgi:hypothetical protein